MSLSTVGTPRRETNLMFTSGDGPTPIPFVGRGLRAQMSALGVAIINDRIYPHIYPELAMGPTTTTRGNCRPSHFHSPTHYRPVTSVRKFAMPESINTGQILPPATITEYNGVRFLHLGIGTTWMQGAMRIAKPDAIVLEYVQQMMAWMLFSEQPRHIVQLGLGSSALTKFCYRHFPEAKVTAIELNPAVIDICRSDFGLPPNDHRLNVMQMDAMDFVMNPANKGAVDVLQIDLYDELARGPVFDTPEFYQACADCLTRDGILTANVFGDHECYERTLRSILIAFDSMGRLPIVEDGNMVAIGFKRSPVIDFGDLYLRAADIQQKMDMPAETWVNGLKEWMQYT